MASLMKEFEQQFGCVTAEITSVTCKLMSDDDDIDKLRLNQEGRTLIGHAYELLEKMELEVKEVPQDQREKLKNRVISYKTELQRLEKEFQKSHTWSKIAIANDERRDLLSGDGAFSINEEEQQKLLDNTETLERASFRLEQSYKVALETEEVGAMVLNDLHHQRETITSARNRLHGADGDLDQSSRILNVMMRRFLQNKFVMISVISIIVFIIFISIATKLIH